jgi:hypothetical protein
MSAGYCGSCHRYRAPFAGGLCSSCEPVECTCEVSTPGEGFWHEHECQVCFRLVRDEVAS